MGRKRILEYEEMIGAAFSAPPAEPEIGAEAVSASLHLGTTGRPKGAIQTHSSRVITTLNTLLDRVKFHPSRPGPTRCPSNPRFRNLFLPPSSGEGRTFPGTF